MKTTARAAQVARLRKELDDGEQEPTSPGDPESAETELALLRERVVRREHTLHRVIRSEAELRLELGGAQHEAERLRSAVAMLTDGWADELKAQARGAEREDAGAQTEAEPTWTNPRRAGDWRGPGRAVANGWLQRGPIFFYQHLGACRRRTPRTGVGLKGSADASRPRLRRHPPDPI